MTSKIILSLAIIGVAGVIGVGATTAYFTDTETSVNNVFTAGTIDIVLDDADELFCAVKDQGPCEADSRCWWDGENGCITYHAAHGVTGTWNTPENWNPGDLWNAYISIHNNGNKNIEQILFYATLVDDTDEGLNPESEPKTDDGTGGLDLMADDIYFWGAEEFVWPSGTYQANVGLITGDGRGQAVLDFNEKYGTDIDYLTDGSVDAFNIALEKLGLGTNDLIPTEIADIVELINFAYQVALTSENFNQSTFVEAFDTDGNLRADLDEFDDSNTKGHCSKNVLFTGEILEPCAVKILVVHWMFDIEAHNNLQGDKVSVDFTFNAIQDGVDDKEVLCGVDPI